MPAKRECDYIELSDDEEDMNMNELSFYDGPPWHPPDIIVHQLNESGIKSNSEQLQTWAVENVVKLLEDECTVPFIARYRREQTNNMEAPVIREIKSSLEELKTVQEKTKTHLDKLAKDKKLTRKLRESLCLSISILELEQLVAPFKIGSKTTLAERARRAGLEPAADCLLGKEPERYTMMHYVKPHVEGCRTASEVEKGVQHIIADIIAKDKTSMDELRLMLKSCRHLVYLSVTKATHTKKNSSKKYKEIDYEKFKLYIDGKYHICNVKHHQVLAINRGEDQGALSVKVILPDTMTNGYLTWCKRKWTENAARSSYAMKIIGLAVDDAYSRLMSPTIMREIRSTLNKQAEKASVDVFGQNLHRLLLTPPVKGQVIMGVDPGFKNGCKLAVISATGDILHTCISYMHVGNRMIERQRLVGVLKDFDCQTVGIGNGTACRQTEEFFSQLISSGALAPLDVKYCIVNEDGASIYSVSPEADKEMPQLDVNLRSAVSIARRLQDPLAELVKISPKHIGVGMYQHDVPERHLKSALADVVEECVSFVGVNLNVCSEVLLKCVAGVTTNMAKKIISHRKRMGLFINRQQLLEIKGLGPKTFKQCAGFVRIMPSHVEDRHNLQEVIVLSDSEDSGEVVKPAKRKKGSAGPSKRRKTTKSSPVSKAEPLDATWIHPESYSPTKELLKMAASSEREIGTEDIKFKLDKVVRDKGSAFLARCIGVGEPTLQLIIDGLKQPINYDIREGFEKPLFKQGVMTLASLQPGMQVTGRVVNRVHFGVFVDIGVETHGLCHNKKMDQHLLRGRTLGPGDKVEVIVANKKVLGSGKVHIDLALKAVL